MERVSVFIDGANFLYGLRSIKERYTNFKFDFENYVKAIVGKRNLVDVYYYDASLKSSKDPSLFKEQQAFFLRLTKIPFKVIICRRQKSTLLDGTETFRIKEDDIRLALDMLRDAYENKYDTVLLISGDGDFVPVVEYVKLKGKSVENYFFEGRVSLGLLNKCKVSYPIDKKIVNKYFYREEQTMLGDTTAGFELKKIIDSKCSNNLPGQTKSQPKNKT